MRYAMRVTMFAVALVAACTTEDGGGSDARRGPLGKADAAGSCVDHCGQQSAGACWCDDACTGYGDCCADYDAACHATACGGFANLPCPAGKVCADDPSDSCDPAAGGADCAGICVDEPPPEPPADSCAGHCDGQAPAGCWCDDACTGYGDCCADHDAVCGDTCAARTGGAFITFDVCGDSITTWVTASAFIDEAIAHHAAGDWRVPTFPLADGADCDADYSWHVDPASPSWSDVTIELCDGCPAYVEQHRGEWLSTVGSWCPWGGTVTSVDDRR